METLIKKSHVTIHEANAAFAKGFNDIKTI